MNQSIKAELHSHTTFSDGDFSPELLAQKCVEKGVEVWSLTDHDTCGGCERAQVAADALGLKFIPGIEISAFHGRSVHLLGYGMDLSLGVIQKYSTKRIQLRLERMGEMVDAMATAGHDISIDDVKSVAGEGGLVRPHLAQALVNKGVAASISDAFNRFIGNDSEFYRETPWPSVAEAIDIVHRAKGKSVLAHPGIYGLDDAIEAWVDSGLDGIECGHPRHTSEDESRYRKIAEKFGLKTTSSSDFHGPERTGGSLFGTVQVDADVVQWLQEL